MKFEPFENIFMDSTSKYNKVRKEEYKPNGLFPIIDQGQTFIGGYTNDENLIVKSTHPIILFGDHTKIFKYVDFPFIIGADGVKVLTLKNNNYNALYFYFYLKSISIVDKGYSRHFKYLKEKKLPVPENISDQIQIANILSKAVTLIEHRTHSIALLDEFLKSTFLEIFGDPVENEKGFKKRNLTEFYINPKEGTKCGPFGSALKKDEYTSTGIPVWTMDNILKSGEFKEAGCLFVSEIKYKELAKYNAKNGDIIISRAGTVGKMCIIKTDVKVSVISSNLIRLRLGKNLLPIYFLSLMKYFQARIIKLKHGNEDSYTHMSTGILDEINFPYPPKELQTQFATIVTKTETLKEQYKNSLQELEHLYGSLSQKAFNGKLNIK